MKKNDACLPMFTLVELEYTGGNPQRDYIIALSLVKHDGKEIIDTYHTYLCPPQLPSDFLLSVCHVSAEQIAAAPRFGDIAAFIAEFTANTTLVGLHIRRLYALIRAEFRREQQRFLRPQLCLYQLLRQFTSPQLPNLNALFAEAGIDFSHSMPQLQRAEALAQLFAEHYNRQSSTHSLSANLSAAHLPPHLSAEKLAQLPAVGGVYYMLDQRQKILYLGKSKNIRHRLFSHFNSDLTMPDKYELKNKIYDIQYRITGSELVALLLESDEIKRYMPPYNRAQRRTIYRYGVYIQQNTSGFYQTLVVKPLQFIESDPPLVQFRDKWGALAFLCRVAVQYQLHPQHCGIPAYETWLDRYGIAEDYFAEIPQLSPQQHNAAIDQLRQHYSYPYANVLLVEQGRYVDEVAIVMIANNCYKGYAYVPAQYVDLPTNELVAATEDYLIPFRENPDVQQIIRNYWRKNEAKLRIVVYENITTQQPEILNENGF